MEDEVFDPAILHADKLLFAVDLVDHVIVRTRPNFAVKNLAIIERAARYRSFMYNRFDVTVMKAVENIDAIHDQQVSRDFFKLKESKGISKESFNEYAEKLREKLFTEEFRTIPFLKYCVRLANLAGYFLSHGVEQAPEFAVDLIIEAFPDGVMDNDTWQKVHSTAEFYVRIGNNYFVDRSASSTDLEDEISSESTSSNSSIIPDKDSADENSVDEVTDSVEMRQQTSKKIVSVESKDSEPSTQKLISTALSLSEHGEDSLPVTHKPSGSGFKRLKHDSSDIE